MDSILNFFPPNSIIDMPVEWIFWLGKENYRSSVLFEEQYKLSEDYIVRIFSKIDQFYQSNYKKSILEYYKPTLLKRDVFENASLKETHGTIDYYPYSKALLQLDRFLVDG